MSQYPVKRYRCSTTLRAAARQLGLCGSSSPWAQAVGLGRVEVCQGMRLALTRLGASETVRRARGEDEPQPQRNHS